MTLGNWHGSLGGYTNHKCRCDECAEVFRAYKRRWNAKNREKLNAEARERYARDPVRGLAIVKRYQERNPEKVTESGRRWRQANPESVRAKNARRRAILVGVNSIPFTADQLRQKFNYYGNRCYLCGADADSMDHVKPIAKGGPHMLANLKPACQSCNSRKGDSWPYLREAAVA